MGVFCRYMIYAPALALDVLPCGSVAGLVLAVK